MGLMSRDYCTLPVMVMLIFNSNGNFEASLNSEHKILYA